MKYQSWEYQVKRKGRLWITVAESTYKRDKKIGKPVRKRKIDRPYSPWRP